MDSELKEVFVVIQCGHEGIENLVYATADGSDAANKVFELRNDIVEARKHMDEVLAEFGDQEDENLNNAWDRLLYEDKISSKEYDNSKYIEPDAYCVQKWDGKVFSCVCKELGCEPEKSWLM